MDSMEPDDDGDESTILGLITACITRDNEALYLLLTGMTQKELSFACVMLASYIGLQIELTAQSVDLDPVEYWRRTVVSVAQLDE